MRVFHALLWDLPVVRDKCSLLSLRFPMTSFVVSIRTSLLLAVMSPKGFHYLFGTADWGGSFDCRDLRVIQTKAITPNMILPKIQ